MKITKKKISDATRKIDLSGFNMQDELNPKIWDKNQKMKIDVKKTILKIADDYFESLNLPVVDIEDVTMTGSLANYNWSKYSDVDLHIVVDYNDLPMDIDLVQDFLKSKSSNWNKEHDIKIYGYDVELYVQDINEPHHSTGIYSVLNNEWNIKPQKKKISFNDKSVKEKTNRLMDRIEGIYNEMGDVDNEEIVNRVEKLTNKIKKMRQSGLESGGEFSVENIVFKVLRRNGMLDRLYDIKTVAYDKSVTLESIIVSESEDPLQWIRDTNPIPIKNKSDEDFDAEYDIVLSYFNKQPTREEGGWKYSNDVMSGSVMWSQDTQNDIIFYATPFWNGESILPIEYQADMGDYGTVVNIDLPKFYYEEELIDWLKNEYPRIVHQEIMSFMGPLAESMDEGLTDRIKNIEPRREIEKIKNKFIKFVRALKQEGKETKESWGIIVNSVKEKRKLTKEEEKIILTQLGDIFKTTGLTIASFLPGGTLYLLLTKVPRFKKYLLPSSFLDGSE